MDQLKNGLIRVEDIALHVRDELFSRTAFNLNRLGGVEFARCS